MRTIGARHALAALVAVALAALAAGAAPAAQAAEAAETCTTLLQSTPPVTVDLDGDGNPDFRMPKIEDVALCTEAGASFVTFPPQVENCSAVRWPPTCMTVRISVLPAHVYAGASARLCASVDGVRVCRWLVETPDYDYSSPRVICVGYDLYGGNPCSHGELVGFE